MYIYDALWLDMYKYTPWANTYTPEVIRNRRRILRKTILKSPSHARRMPVMPDVMEKKAYTFQYS